MPPLTCVNCTLRVQLIRLWVAVLRGVIGAAAELLTLESLRDIVELAKQATLVLV